MNFLHKKTHRDKIWCYHNKTVAIQHQLCDTIANRGFIPVSLSKEWKYCQYGLPVLWHRNGQIISWRVEDSLFMEDIEAWTRPKPSAIISDNIPLRPIAGNDINLYPEHMHVYHCDPNYIDREPIWMYNCFMNRISGDRSLIFYELIRRNLLSVGLVSFNCFRPGNNRRIEDVKDYSEENYDWQYQSADLVRYTVEHEAGRKLIPYNNIEPNNLELEQCIIDSCVSLVLETYISDDHIVFSEKLFRAMQMPRPWLLYSSPGAVGYLRNNGFDMLDDYVDHSDYDCVKDHFTRLLRILDQLEKFREKKYIKEDYVRFNQAKTHNQNLLLEFESNWPAKFSKVIEEIKNL